MAEKKRPDTVEAKRTMIEHDHPDVSVRRQCELIGLNRSTAYHQPAGESEYNLRLMRLIDQQYLETPFYGWPRMTAYLRRKGHKVNHKRVQRLMQLMGLEAIYPKPNTSKPAPGHKIFPYLLRGLAITRPNQVWSSDTLAPAAQAQVSTGTVDMCWPGNSPTPWMVSSAWMFCVRPSNKAGLTSLTPIKALSSQPMRSPTSCWQLALGSAWIVGAALLTTS